VHDVSVVGVPDDEWGELVVAFVVPGPERPAPTLTELRDFAREHLSGPKLPRAAHTVDEIPRTNSGKPLRRLLRERAVGERATEGDGGT
jgi:acyl-CoA synthetase (AMP-forming)/AMP-acid ligase II